MQVSYNGMLYTIVDQYQVCGTDFYKLRNEYGHTVSVPVNTITKG